jgi:hypothetical protein
MKLNSRLSLLFCAVIFISISCSKDKTMERQIQKKDGVWNIDLVSWTIVEQTSYAPYQRISNGSTSNAGTFTFDNDGSGKYSYTVNDSVSRAGSFTWTVDNEKASLISATQTIDYNTFAITQKAVAYTGTQDSKTKLTLEGTETDQYGSGTITQFVITATFTMSKK